MKPVQTYLFLILAISVLFTACDKTSRSTGADKFSDIDRNKILAQHLTDLDSSSQQTTFQMEIQVPKNNENGILMSEIIDTVWYLKLGKIPNNLMTDLVIDLKFHKDQIYLMDGKKNEIFVFDNKGNHLYSLHAEGEGPGEFTRASNIAIDPYKDQLLIHDDRLSKLLYYTLQGQFIKEHGVAFRFNDFTYINDHLIAVDLNKTYNDHLPEIRNNQLVIVDTTWKVLAKGGAYNATEEKNLFFTGEVFSRKNTESFYLRPFTYEVYKFDQESLHPFCRLNFGEKNLPDDTNFNFSDIGDFWKEYSEYSYLVDNGYFLKDVTYFEHFYEGRKRAHIFRSNTTGNILHGSVNNDIFELGFFHISTSIPEKNLLVSYISSEEIYAKKRDILESESVSEALRKMVSDTESTDNPVLIFYKLRSDF